MRYISWRRISVHPISVHLRVRSVSVHPRPPRDSTLPHPAASLEGSRPLTCPVTEALSRAGSPRPSPNHRGPEHVY